MDGQRAAVDRGVELSHREAQACAMGRKRSASSSMDILLRRQCVTEEEVRPTVGAGQAAAKGCAATTAWLQ